MAGRTLCALLCLWFGTASANNVDVTYPVIFKSDPGNYFGYSVALHRNRDGPLALIGAPRANSSTLRDRGIIEPGVLFQCEIEKTRKCKEIILDERGNTLHYDDNSDFSYHDMKNNMWLGVSLDVRRNSGRNDVVTCGHLWKNQHYQHHYLANGVCYVVNGDLDTSSNRVSKLVPFVDKRKQAIKNRNYKYAFGQVGTSATFSEDGRYLLLGAPGFHDWKGTVVSYTLDSNQPSRDFSRPAIPDEPLIPDELSPESYVGYSVTSGKFYDTNAEYVAVGAPRDGGFHGRVYIYETLKVGDKKIEVHHKKEGSQLGEYFGASVLGINLNADEYTDLIVGSPFFSTDTGVDEGKVYVFISNGIGLQPFAELYGELKFYARFGTSIANAGDLNQDGFNDIVIGAPYEDNNGVIYIYHGSRAGLNTQYSQRISAAEIDTSLSGFGIQISRGFDIDINQYPDLLVGAYASSNAVLFRTKPLIQLYSKIIFSPQQINTNVTNCIYEEENVPCVNVTACLWYSGKHVPLNLEFQHAIFVEYGSQSSLLAPRGFFIENGSPTTSIQQNATLLGGNEFCSTNILYIRPKLKDVITPIQMLYRYDLIDPPKRLRRFNSSHPVVDPLSPTNTTSAITFQTGCGTDDKCLSDLVLTGFVVGNKENQALVIGTNSSLSLSIEIVNMGEPAYLSELFVQLPPELPSIKQDVLCSTLSDQSNQRKNASLVCDLGNPLKTGEKVNIVIKIDLMKIPTNKKEVFIGLEAITASSEVKPSDNSLRIPLYFIAIADISITGTSAHEQIQFNEETRGRRPIPVSHSYFVMNHGPSPVQVIDIILNIPTSFQKSDNIVEFITFTSLEADSGKLLTIPAKCNDSYIPMKPIPIEDGKLRDEIFDDDELIIENEVNRSKTTMNLDFGIDNPLDKRETSVPSRLRRSNEKKSTRKMKDILINCATAKCMTIQCEAKPFIDTRKFAKITVSVLLNMSTLNDFLDPWYRIEFNTTGEVYIREDNSGIIPNHRYPDKISIRTTIVSSALPTSEQIDQWIIFLSIGIGILLLLIILALLIKFGFFKREQKEKMEKLKSNEFEAEETESEALN